MLKKIAWNTLVQILGKGVAVVISLLTTGLLTRKLGTTIYGQYILITSLSVFFNTLADFGTSIIGVREAAKEESEEGRRKVWSNMAILRLMMAMFSLALGMIFIFAWPDLREIRVETSLAWVMMVFTSLAGSLGIIWQTRMKMENKVLIEVMFPTVFLLCLWRFKGEISLVWVFGTYLVARIITLLWGWWLTRGSIKWMKLDVKLMKKFLMMSWPMGVYLLVFSAYDRAMDSMMIRRFLGPEEVAWYGLAYKIYGVLVQPAYYLVSSIFPLLSSRENNKKLFLLSTGVLFSGGITVMLGTWILAPLMINVLAGSEFAASVAVLRILAVALVFSYLGHIVGFTLISKERQKEMLVYGIVAMLFNFSANLVVIPSYGIIGAAWVTVLTELISMLLMASKLRKRA